ncbi:MAG: M48 family metalloprotease [Candidatus Omnitrophica bacterium]|nr:M48 family metalloprotease [Candidatus Omnitrophota bacterium]
MPSVNFKIILKIILIVLTPFFLAACETLNVKPMSVSEQFSREDDETRLWKRQDEFEETLKKSGFIYQDEELTKYANEVLHKLAGNFEQPSNVDLRMYIINSPDFNAFCLCNGAIFVHTSILANADNEAQLATVLAHEATHFLYRHELRAFRNLKNKGAFLSTVQVTLAGAPGGYGDLASLFGQTAIVGSVYGYSRQMEREADKNAFDLLIKSGYDPTEAKKFLEKLSEIANLEDKKIPYFYSTHPRYKERIRDYEEFIQELSKEGSAGLSGISNTETYNKMTKGVLIDNTELEIRANKLKLAKIGIQKIRGLYPEDFIGYYYSGQREALENERDEAEKDFKKAIELNQEYPEAHKGLGMLYYKKGDKQLAKPELERYLQLKPDAADANYIRGYINE